MIIYFISSSKFDLRSGMRGIYREKIAMKFKKILTGYIFTVKLQGF